MVAALGVKERNSRRLNLNPARPRVAGELRWNSGFSGMFEPYPFDQERLNGSQYILVCLDPTEAGERRLRLAAAIAREHHAHLSAAYILSEAIPGASTYEGVGIPA